MWKHQTFEFAQTMGNPLSKYGARKRLSIMEK